ncbi:MAG: EI24 domain-containing protein, partial [Rhodoferax sp.]
SSPYLNHAWAWLEGVGLGQLKTVLAPLIVIFTVTPLIVVLSLLMVAFLMTPQLVRLVAKRRFAALEMRAGASLLGSLVWSLGSTLAALTALVLTVPLWFVPPLILVLPPLIWGWLTYRVMAFDALAEHATAPERVLLLRRHRLPLLAMGVICGFLGAAPNLVWASGALFAAAFVILAPVAIWIYTLVFVFASLWFAHYCLGALQALRREPVVLDVQASLASAEVARVAAQPPT